MTAHSQIPLPAEAPADVVTPSRVLLPGGDCSIHCFSRLAAPLPDRASTTGAGDGPRPWVALSWQGGEGWHAVAVLGAASLGNLRLGAPDGTPLAQIGTATAVATEAAALAAHLGETGAPVAEVLALLEQALGPAVAATGGSSGSVRRFMTELLRQSSAPDGFVEVVVLPDCGGVFLQGWAQRRLAGPVRLMGDGAGLPAVAAVFERDDILAPAGGLCLYVKDWDGRIDRAEAIFIEDGDRPLRLDLLPGSASPLEGLGATEHVRAMLPRLAAPAPVIAGIRRILRPRFAGRNTLAEHGGPVTAAIDRIFATPSGGLYVTGWLLDPLAQVGRVILKSTANLYAPLDRRWHRVERPDLNEAFGNDPRFAGILDPRDRLHGFICALQAAPETLGGAQVYLELVLRDDSCLFLPCDLTPCVERSAAHPVLATLMSHDPGLAGLITDHAAPFLATVPCNGVRRASLLVRPLGGGPAGRDVAALMPVPDPAHLQPVMASLAGTPEAAALDLVLVIDRDRAMGLCDTLDDQFRFFGLRGTLVMVAGHETVAGRLDAGLAVTEAPEILIWQTAVLPRRPGWLRPMLAAAASAGGNAAVAPLIGYEDGSIYFGGSDAGDAPPGAVCALVGFEGRRIPRGPTRPASALPAEIALVGRSLLEACGGFRGGLWGDRYIGQDLAHRLRAEGARALCATATEFWMLDSAAADPGPPGVLERIDAALIDRLLAGGPATLHVEKERP